MSSLLPRPFPTYDLRDRVDLAAIARAFADGSRIAMFGGVWGVFKRIDPTAPEEPYFHAVKRGRPATAKIAMVVTPRAASDLIEWPSVHPAFRSLEGAGRITRLWATHGAYLHVIGPVSAARDLPDVVVTTPADYRARYPAEPTVPSATASFVSRCDPHLESVMTTAEALAGQPVLVGVSTLNAHGAQPPYTLEELADQLARGEIDPDAIDLVVRDTVYESRERCFGSHTQVRLPFPSETPELRVLRVGTLSPAGLSRATGFPVVTIAGARDVRRHAGLDGDDDLQAMGAELQRAWAAGANGG